MNTIIEDLKLTRQKINRSISNIMDNANNYNVFELPLPELILMKEQVNLDIDNFYAAKKAASPFLNIEPKVSDKFEVGAILYDSWGWEQTNIDYYCIVKRTNLTVTILPMKKQTSEEVSFMSNHETPLEINFKGDPIRKTVKSFNGKESGFTLRDYSGGGWVSLYNGVPKTSSHYA